MSDAGPVVANSGVLVQAKRRGFVAAVRPLLDKMTANGYFLSQRVVDGACHEAGEG